MGLLDQFKAYVQANTPRATRPVASPSKVINEGLLNPNKYNAPAANRFKDSAFGLLGGIPGADAPVGFTQGADLWNRGEKGAAAVSVAGGLLPFIPVMGGMFIGKGAKTWDALKAQQADELLKQGADPREVWKQTGTAKFADGMLRQEIPDNLADIEKSHPMAWLSEMSPLGKDIPLEQAQQMGKQYNDAVDQVNMFGSGNGVMESMLLHRPMYDAYPDLRTTRLSFDPMGSAYGGSFDEAANKVSLARGNLGNAKKGKSTTLHELQHAIQQREGWARGGSPDMMRQELAGGDLTGLYTPEELNNAYRRLAGEAEARLTQSRMNLDPAQRLQHYPYDMGEYGLDVPMDQLIVRGLLNK